MTASVTLPHRRRQLPGDAPTAMPAVLVSARAHHLHAITSRLGMPTRRSANTSSDAEQLAEVLGERRFGVGAGVM